MATYFFCNIIPSRTQSSQSPKININFLREDIGPSTKTSMPGRACSVVHAHWPLSIQLLAANQVRTAIYSTRASWLYHRQDPIWQPTVSGHRQNQLPTSRQYSTTIRHSTCHRIVLGTKCMAWRVTTDGCSSPILSTNARKPNSTGSVVDITRDIYGLSTYRYI